MTDQKYNHFHCIDHDINRSWYFISHRTDSTYYRIYINIGFQRVKTYSGRGFHSVLKVQALDGGLVCVSDDVHRLAFPPQVVDIDLAARSAHSERAPVMRGVNRGQRGVGWYTFHRTWKTKEWICVMVIENSNIFGYTILPFSIPKWKNTWYKQCECIFYFSI